MTDLKALQLDFFSKQERLRGPTPSRGPTTPSSHISAGSDEIKPFRAATFKPKQKVQVGTQNYKVVELLKARRSPLTLPEIATACDVALIRGNELFQQLEGNARLDWDPVRDTFSYRPKYQLGDKEHISRFMREKSEGVLRAELNDCYSRASADVEALLQSRDVFTLRNTENHADVIYGNRLPTVKLVEDEVRLLWEKTKLDDSTTNDDLERELVRAGMAPTRVEEEEVKPEKEDEKKDAKKRMRPIKLTNTHVDKDLQLSATLMGTDSAAKRVKAAAAKKKP